LQQGHGRFDRCTVPFRESFNVFVLDEQNSSRARIHGVGNASCIGVMDFPLINIWMQVFMDGFNEGVFVQKWGFGLI